MSPPNTRMNPPTGGANPPAGGVNPPTRGARVTQFAAAEKLQEEGLGDLPAGHRLGNGNSIGAVGSRRPEDIDSTGGVYGGVYRWWRGGAPVPALVSAG
eukprot:1178216-Prorocentrum_minimum.AAC.1